MSLASRFTSNQTTAGHDEKVSLADAPCPSHFREGANAMLWNCLATQAKRKEMSIDQYSPRNLHMAINAMIQRQQRFHASLLSKQTGRVEEWKSGRVDEKVAAPPTASPESVSKLERSRTRSALRLSGPISLQGLVTQFIPRRRTVQSNRAGGLKSHAQRQTAQTEGQTGCNSRALWLTLA